MERELRSLVQPATQQLHLTIIPILWERTRENVGFQWYSEFSNTHTYTRMHAHTHVRACTCTHTAQCSFTQFLSGLARLDAQCFEFDMKIWQACTHDCPLSPYTQALEDRVIVAHYLSHWHQNGHISLPCGLITSAMHVVS